MDSTGVIVVEDHDSSEWKSELDSSRGASVFSSPRWLDAFRSPSRFPVYYRIVDGSGTIGVAAGLECRPRRRLGGPRRRDLLFFAGPSVRSRNGDTIATCVDALIRFARRHAYSRVTFGSWDYQYALPIRSGVLRTQTRSEFVVDLEPSLPRVLRRLRPSIARKARQAARNGVSFHTSASPAIVEQIAALLAETRSVRLDKGYVEPVFFYMPHLSETVLRQLLRNGAARVFYARRGRRIISAEFVVRHGRRAFGLLNGTTRDGYRLGAHPFVLVNLINRMKQDGMERLNLGGLPGDRSAAAMAFFKRSLGADELRCEGGRTPFLCGPQRALNGLFGVTESAKRATERLLGEHLVGKLVHLRHDIAATANHTKECNMDLPGVLTPQSRAFDPIAVARATERVVCRGTSRKYARFGSTINYGGVATGYVAGCGLRCVFCWAGETRDRPEDGARFYSPWEAFQELTDVAERERLDLARISDGEPTIGADHLLELIELCEDSFFKCFYLETSGILLGADRDLVRRLARFKKVSVRVSLKAGTAEAFTLKTGAIAEAFELPFAAIRYLREEGVPFWVAAMSADPRFMDPLERVSLIGRLAAIDPALVLNLEEEAVILYPESMPRLAAAGWSPGHVRFGLLQRLPLIGRFIQVCYPRTASLSRHHLAPRFTLKAVREIFNGT